MPEHDLPRTETEREVARIWSDLLGVSEIGMQDDFFELGGHSLLLVELLFRIRQRFEVQLPLRVIYGSPTVARIVEEIGERGR